MLKLPTIPNNAGIYQFLDSKKNILYKLVDYKKGQEVTPEEFENFCVWVSRAAENMDEAAAIVTAFIESLPNLKNIIEREPQYG